MAEEMKVQNENCVSNGHDEHLCFLRYEGFHYKNKEAYKEIVQDAQYRCQNCGRTARSDTNLCEPVNL